MLYFVIFVVVIAGIHLFRNNLSNSDKIQFAKYTWNICISFLVFLILLILVYQLNSLQEL